MVCENIEGGFSKLACFFWLSFLHENTAYFEWGSGFTTKVSNQVVKSGTSVEGSFDWFNHMKHSYEAKRMNLVYIDIGRTRKFSWPVNAINGTDYVNAISSSKYDVVLVDGRWRVACGAKAYGHLKENGTVLVHDFKRKEYHELLKLYTKIGEVDTLVALKPKYGKDHLAQQIIHSFLKTAYRR